ncbi:hypothetical protein [Aquimarina algiphila]|uniref:hypothetical protein n=1 Tax=Aquimarina algiphila TaxID=2047982 RepID=UPI00232F2314|nr:hypothetical protein [Aquimarina algiphila]
MESNTNNTDKHTVKPHLDRIDIHTEALQIYNIMPKGTKELAAQKYSCAAWYLKNLITDLKTDPSKMTSIVLSIAEASKEHTENVNFTNKELQKMATDFIKKYS